MELRNPRAYILFSSLVLITAGIWIWLSRVPADDISSSGIYAPRKGFFAPDFTLQTAEGETITLSDLRGKAVLINLWASWCPPCRAEMPAMQKVYEANAEEGFTVLAINTTYQDDPSIAIDFVKELGLSFPILMDQEGSVSQLYQSSALPTSFFVDREGIIQEVVVGGPMSDTLLKIRVEQLLGSSQ